jgi:hypothetical protein
MYRRINLTVVLRIGSVNSLTLYPGDMEHLRPLVHLCLQGYRQGRSVNLYIHEGDYKGSSTKQGSHEAVSARMRSQVD